MKSFGITQATKKTWKSYIKYMNGAFVALILICFIIFTFFAKISDMVFSKDKIDVFQQNLGQIAFYFWAFDKDLSNFLLTLDDIIQGYNKGENIFITKEKEINLCWEYIEHNKEYLKKVGFSNYDKLINFLSDIKVYQKEFFELLGKNQSFNYLVILQNTNEKRPNGGFFGSFAFIKVDQGHIKTLEIVDSYYPDFIAYRTRIIAPERTAPFLPDRKIGFIAGNKFGFSDIDGKNLKDLYELMFNKTFEMSKVQQTMQPDLYNKLLHQDIKGVIFIRSDLLESFFTTFKQKVQERQFLNASVDLIRKQVRGNKKELYIKEIKQYFDSQKGNIIKNVVNRFDEIANKQFVTMYLSNVSTGLNAVLTKHNLTNIFDPNYIYFWDTNTSYNKIDGFLTKHIQINNEQGMIQKDSKSDIVDIRDLKNGKYTINIYYKFGIPDYYPALIKEFEKKYEIQITDREMAILGLKSGMYDEPGQGKVRKRRETKATIYFPQYIKVTNVTGDIYYQAPFYAPFANGLFYQMGSIENNSTRVIKINIEVNK
ncbi:MAG: DUF4012 domain-containing protein [candidate division SR1 bacterium]|nr:DUF4012 domain-containing protein [candidate division SR1 bacterium]